MSTQQELTPPKVKLSPLSDAIGKRFIGHTLIDDSDSDVLLVFDGGVICKISADGEDCSLSCYAEDNYNPFSLSKYHAHDPSELLDLGVITEEMAETHRKIREMKKAKYDEQGKLNRREQFLRLKAEFEPESINKKPA